MRKNGSTTKIKLVLLYSFNREVRYIYYLCTIVLFKFTTDKFIFTSDLLYCIL